MNMDKERQPIERAVLDVRHRARQRWNRFVRPAWLAAWRRRTPLSAHWGFDRGTPIDRFFIEQFLSAHAADIRGHGLEVKDSTYLKQFGTGLTQVDVLDIDPGNTAATIVADLAAPDGLPSDRFDCIVLTQTLHFVFDVATAIRQLHRALRPGGVLLATMPSVSRLDRQLEQCDYWRFTPPSCRKLFGDEFGHEQIAISSYGNMRTAVAFLLGLACEELAKFDLETTDERFPLLVAVRATKRMTPAAPGIPA